MVGRWIRVGLVGLLALAAAARSPFVSAQSQGCTFQLGFASLRAHIPDQLGTCLDDEHFNDSNGNAEQQTTGGLLVWRKADNWTAFTNGYETWLSGPNGIQKRLNTQRFSWEADAGAPGTTLVSSQQRATVAVAPPRAVERGGAWRVLVTFPRQTIWRSAPLPVRPVGIAVDATGNVYASGLDSVYKVSPAGAILGVWDGTGGGPMQSPNARFGEPRGLALDPEGFLYVAEGFMTHRVRKVTPTGVVVAEWRNTGDKGGYKRVGCPGTGCPEAEQEFVAPSGVAVSQDGTTYVSDSQNVQVVKLSAAGVPLARFGDENLRPNEAQGLTLGSGYNTAPGKFRGPNGLALDASGNLYVADTGNHRIQKLSPDGLPLAQWGTRGVEPGQFIEPIGVAVDRSGNIFVADTGNHRIQVLSPAGQPLAQWGSLGGKVGQFQSPTSVSVDGAGNIFVADYGNERIQKFAVR